MDLGNEANGGGGQTDIMQRHRGCSALAADGSTEAASQAACSRRGPKRGAAASAAGVRDSEIVWPGKKGRPETGALAKSAAERAKEKK